MGSPFAPLAPLSMPAPVPMRFAWARAATRGPAGELTYNVLFIDTPSGSHVFYFEDAVLRDFLDQGAQQLTGLMIVRDPLRENGNGHGP